MKTARSQKTIRQLFNEDRNDRLSKIFKRHDQKKRLLIIGKRDAIRAKKIIAILNQKPKLRGLDYFRMGWILKYGQTKEVLKISQEMAKKSFERGYKKGKWLYAAATDCLCITQGKNQKFGTQFGKHNGVWKLLPVQKTTTDAERKKYNVSSFKKIGMVLRSLNRGANLSHHQKTLIGLTRKR